MARTFAAATATRALTIAAGGLLVVLTIGPAQARSQFQPGWGVVKVGSRPYVSLADALEAVKPGDTIRLGNGRHLAVPVTRKLDGLTILGGSGVLDGKLELHGNGIRLRNVATDHGSVTIHGDRARVSRCAFLLEESRLRIVGDRARVERSVFYGSLTGTSLIVEGDRAKVTRNEFGYEVLPGNPSLGIGAQVVGDRALVRDNAFAGLATAADVSGARPRFERNQGVALFGGARVRGNDAKVRKNVIELVPADPLQVSPLSLPPQEVVLEVSGDSARVQRNAVSRGYLTADQVGPYFQDMINQARTTFINLTVDAEELSRLAGSGVGVTGDHARVEHNAVEGTSFGVSVAGARANVSDNSFHWVDVAADVKGDDAQITDNQVTRALMGVQVVGDDFSVERNTMDVGRISAVGLGTMQVTAVKDAPDIVVWNFEGEPVELTGCPGVLAQTDQGGGAVRENVVVHELGGVGYELDVDEVTIADNVDVGAPDATVSVTITGDDNVLSDNVVRDFGESGVELSGVGNVATGNQIGAGAGDAFIVEGSANEIERNEIGVVGGLGLMVTGTDNLVHGNSVAAAAADAICIEGDRNEVTRNDVNGTRDDAFVVNGSQNALADNYAEAARGDGFCVLGGSGNVLTNCTALDCAQDGLENLATNTSVFGSTFLRNTRDVAGTGTFFEFTGNEFGSFLVE